MQENLNLETLQKQYQIVKSETDTSHVMEYGDMVSSDCEFWLLIKLKWDVKLLSNALLFTLCICKNPVLGYWFYLKGDYQN